MKKRFLYMLLSVFISSCSKEVIIDVPMHNSSPVFNCLATPDSRIVLNVSKSIGIYDTGDDCLDDLKILLFENNTLIDTFAYTNFGQYVSKTYPKFGKIYKIYSLVNGKEVATSIEMPNEILYLDIIDSEEIYVNAEGSEYTGIRLKIVDDKSIISYYSIRIIFKNSYREASLHIFSNDIILKAEGLESYSPQELVFNNALFSKDTTDLFINYFTPSESEHEIIVCVKKTSYSYYMYKKQLTKHLYNQDGDIWDGVGDPVQMYTNIEGGYGIFAGYSQVIDTIHE